MARLCNSNININFSSDPGSSLILYEACVSISTTIIAFFLLILAALYVHYDYRAFLSLGPGGTPSTPLGYIKIKMLSLICLRNPIRPQPIPPHFRPQTGYLRNDALPTRKGARPLVQGVAPQRQKTQKSNASTYARLVEQIRELASDSSNQLVERTSCFEKHSSGLFTTVPITQTCGGEVCHAHPSDGSMHMTLHPADAKLMLESGWGERHPLARGGWCRRFVPREFVLIYAPRSAHEVDIVLKIVAASVWWVSGMDVVDKNENSMARGTDVADFTKAAQGKPEGWVCEVHGCGSKQLEKMLGNV